MTDPYTPQIPATLDAANAKLERYAALASQLATSEEAREASIAGTNAVADAIALPILKEMGELRADLAPWWPTVAADLTKGKRKTVELGGCTIGTKAGTAKVAHTHADDDAAVEALMGVPWMKKALIKTSFSLDRTAIKAQLKGSGAKLAKLKSLGFSLPDAPETFILERVTTSGTVPSLGA